MATHDELRNETYFTADEEAELLALRRAEEAEAEAEEMTRAALAAAVKRFYPHLDLRTGRRYRVVRVATSDGIVTRHEFDTGENERVRVHTYAQPRARLILAPGPFTMETVR